MSRFLSFLFFLVLSHSVLAQVTEINYNIINDEPESINKLFIGFQPLYGEVWSTNPNLGFGLQATYYPNEKIHFDLNYRRPYGSSFDMMRQSAKANSNMENETRTMNYFELGATFHLKDKVEDGTTSMVLYKPGTTKKEWSSQMPQVAEIDCKVRTIAGGRIGTFLFNSTADINRFVERQGIDYSSIQSAEGSSIPTEFQNELFETQQVNMFTNTSAIGMYLGGSFTWIKNVSVDLTGYEPNAEDQIFTAYFDLLIGFDTSMDNLFYEGIEYSLDPLETVPFGGRIGIQSLNNRKISMSYGAEVGYRPGLKKGGFFGTVKVAFPVFGTKLDSNSVQAYESD